MIIRVGWSKLGTEHSWGNQGYEPRGGDGVLDLKGGASD